MGLVLTHNVGIFNVIFTSSTYATKLGGDFLILHLICFVHCDNIFFVYKLIVMFSKNCLSSLFSMIENGSVVVTHARLRCRQQSTVSQNDACAMQRLASHSKLGRASWRERV